MKLETPGKRQSTILERIFFSLPHKPINFHNTDTSTTSPILFTMPNSDKDDLSENGYSDDDTSSTYSEGDEDNSMVEDSDALDENLSDTEDESSEGDYEEVEVIDSSETAQQVIPQEKKEASSGVKSNNKERPKLTSNSKSKSNSKPSPKPKSQSPKAKATPKNKPVSLTTAMKKKNLFGASNDGSKNESPSSFPNFPTSTSQSTKKKQDSKTYRLSGGYKKKPSQEIIPIGNKAAAEKKQSRLNFRKDTSGTSSTKPKPKPKQKSKPTAKPMEVDEPEGSFESSLQTMNSTKMENGTYRGKVAYIVRRGNLTPKYIMQVPRRGKRHPVLGESEKQPTLTEQIKSLTESKLLRFRDLTYVYIHASGKKDKDGVFVAGLFTSSGTMTHVNATTVELPAYKELYAEEGGTSHRQAKIKDVITSENKQKGTSFVLKIEDGSEEKMVELQLPFLSTQAYHSIVNEDRRVTKQRQGREKEKERAKGKDKEKEKDKDRSRETTPTATASAVSALAKATSGAVNRISQGTSCALGAHQKRKRDEIIEAPEPDSPVVWPLSDKKRRILGQIMAKMHEGKIEKFAVAVNDGSRGREQKLYTVNMNIDSVNLI